MQISNFPWNNYRSLIFEKFPDLKYQSTWADWEENGAFLSAKYYRSEYIIKSREGIIWDEKTSIYNNILYPKTGQDLPCFGMDLMKFFDKKVIIVFDFQHPRENYLFSHPDLPKAEGDYRFFEPGNHFSENIFVRKCTIDQVNDYLDDFENYLNIFKEMLENKKPFGYSVQSTYSDFDKYMKRLDPVSGYITSKFGKEKSESFVSDFLFSYA
jgi:hypothetical protein